jgi:hypothetical protein
MNAYLARIATAALAAATIAGVGLVVANPAAAASPCDTSDLSAKVTGTAAGMSQPSTFITVTNISGSTCTVKGYPTITRMKTKKGAQKFTVTNGAVMNAPKPKVKTLSLAPGGKAWFAIGTATAYDPPLVTFTKMAFALAPGTSVGDSLKVKITQPATAPSGKPFPVGVTAFGKGTGTGE